MSQAAADPTSAPLGAPIQGDPRKVGGPQAPPPSWLTLILAFTYTGAVGGSLAWAWATHQTFQTWITTWAPSVTGVILAVVGFYFGRQGTSG